MFGWEEFKVGYLATLWRLMAYRKRPQNLRVFDTSLAEIMAQQTDG